uniref:Ig-like domain-containing protein n=1 Tax=Oryzias melastigma TaxID=30732 RepID=A0A3B3E0L0_ORYME
MEDDRLENITAEPGDDVTLTCDATNIEGDLVFEWNRTALQKGEKLFVYRDNKPYSEDQHESFKNRVFLKKNPTKNGDLSNVTVNDTGTYECYILKGSENRNTSICTINLEVSPPPGEY